MGDKPTVLAIPPRNISEKLSYHHEAVVYLQYCRDTGLSPTQEQFCKVRRLKSRSRLSTAIGNIRKEGGLAAVEPSNKIQEKVKRTKQKEKRAIDKRRNSTDRGTKNTISQNKSQVDKGNVAAIKRFFFQTVYEDAKKFCREEGYRYNAELMRGWGKEKREWSQNAHLQAFERIKKEGAGDVLFETREKVARIFQTGIDALETSIQIAVSWLAVRGVSTSAIYDDEGKEVMPAMFYNLGPRDLKSITSAVKDAYEIAKAALPDMVFLNNHAAINQLIQQVRDGERTVEYAALMITEMGADLPAALTILLKGPREEGSDNIVIPSMDEIDAVIEASRNRLIEDMREGLPARRESAREMRETLAAEGGEMYGDDGMMVQK